MDEEEALRAKARRMASYGHEQAMAAFRMADPDRSRDLLVDALDWYRSALEELGVRAEKVVDPRKSAPEGGPGIRVHCHNAPGG